MEAPIVELLTRLALSLVMTGTFVALVSMTRVVWKRQRPSRWVALYMTVMLGVFAVWRWFVLWLGTQPETVDYQVNWEPTVRTVGSWLLMLVIFGFGVAAVHHTRELRAGRHP